MPDLHQSATLGEAHAIVNLATFRIFAHSHDRMTVRELLPFSNKPITSWIHIKLVYERAHALKMAHIKFLTNLKVAGR